MAEPFSFSIFNQDTGQPITGAEASCRIKFIREADRYIYDFQDGTFKNTGWGQMEGTMYESSATNDPGSYYLNQDTSQWNDGRYIVVMWYLIGTHQEARRDFYVKDGVVW